MKKWMIFMREADGVNFLWNGEGCIRVSPIASTYATQLDVDISAKWHHDYGELPETEQVILRSATNSHRQKIMTIPKHGRYQIVCRGEFK